MCGNSLKKYIKSTVLKPDKKGLCFFPSKDNHSMAELRDSCAKDLFNLNS